MRFSSVLCQAFILASLVSGRLQRRADDPPPTKYPASLDVTGNMNRTDVDLEDGFAIDVLSPSAHKLNVDRNFTLTPALVVASGGGSNWVHINNYSWVMSTDRPARDVVGKVEAPYVPEDLARKGVAVQNTFVGQLSTDGTHWIVDDSTRNVHVSENVTRIIKMTDMTGTYALLGRVGGDFSNIFIQYAFGETRTFNLTAGNGLQNGQFIDGFEMQVACRKDVRINANVNQPIQGNLPQDTIPLTQYSYVVNSSSPADVTSARMLLPFTDFLVENTNSSRIALVVAHRRTANDQFELITNSTVDTRTQLVTASNLTNVDGEWVIAVQRQG